ncbi:hypothetical protein BDK51DRAFT_28901 [Blyttiomyces helicus]|uniref:Uncharacterized protein n=1 Tax=Blyttiomyces helicus TaxID=388810 RepID=A0A4P9WR22_9FUNG|nr:hypothetical protein BDK51DRAFT_28901 [Blyttiomyces helicus]|eukprot:RKO94288.1 hypothetical protein BDK51DRAFT_28901 [Blyttiomyces helicus]
MSKMKSNLVKLKQDLLEMSKTDRFWFLSFLKSNNIKLSDSDGIKFINISEIPENVITKLELLILHKKHQLNQLVNGFSPNAAITMVQKKDNNQTLFNFLKHENNSSDNILQQDRKVFTISDNNDDKCANKRVTIMGCAESSFPEDSDDEGGITGEKQFKQLTWSPLQRRIEKKIKDCMKNLANRHVYSEKSYGQDIHDRDDSDDAQSDILNIHADEEDDMEEMPSATLDIKPQESDDENDEGPEEKDKDVSVNLDLQQHFQDEMDDPDLEVDSVVDNDAASIFEDDSVMETDMDSAFENDIKCEFPAVPMKERYLFYKQLLRNKVDFGETDDLGFD